MYECVRVKGWLINSPPNGWRSIDMCVFVCVGMRECACGKLSRHVRPGMSSVSLSRYAIPIHNGANASPGLAQ